MKKVLTWVLLAALLCNLAVSPLYPTALAAEPDVLTVEAESGTFLEGKDSGAGISTGDGNFAAVSGGSCIRMYGGPARIEYQLEIPEDGYYTIAVYVGSRSDNSGTDRVMLDGVTYTVTVPAGAMPQWHAAALELDGTAVEQLALEAGTHTLVLEYAGAAWCYYDKITLEKVADLPVTAEVEAENGSVISGGGISSGDGNFTAVSGESCIRIWANETKIDYTVIIPEDGLYQLTGLVGSLSGNSGVGTVTVGEITGKITVPDGTAPEWVEAVLSDAAGKPVELALTAGEYKFSLTVDTADWTYYDKFIFTRTGDLPEEPEEPEGIQVEAESGSVISGGGISSGDGNFTAVSGESCIRIWANETKIDYTITIPEDGLYQLTGLVGSLSGNSGVGTVTVGEITGKITVPDGTAPEWAEAVLSDAAGKPVELALTAGEYKFSLTVDTADWTYYDKFIFTRTGDLPPEEPDGIQVEAESGSVVSGGGVSSGDGNFTAVSGESCIRIWANETKINYTVTIQEDGLYQLTGLVGSLPGNSGVGTVTVGEITGKITVPDGTAPEWVEAVLSDAAGKPVELALTAGEYKFSLTVDTADWTYYDKFIFTRMGDLPTEPEDTQAVEDAIQALPEPEHLAVEHGAAVDAAWDLYQALSPQGQAAITPESVIRLTTARARIQALRQDAQAPAGRYLYEMEDGVLSGNTALVGQDGAMNGYSGDGYVYLFNSKVTVRFYAPEAGKYRVVMASGNDDGNAKCDLVCINGGNTYLQAASVGQQNQWQLSSPGLERWIDGVLKPQSPASGFVLQQGWNELQLSASWGYACYDYFYIEPVVGFDFDGYFTVAEVNELASAVPELDAITQAHHSQIKDSYRAYMSLTQEQRENVTGRERLLMANARVDAMTYLPDAPAGTLWYELEAGRMGGNTAVSTSREVYDSYSGSGYVYIFDGSMELEFYVPERATYNIHLLAGSNPDNDKCDYVRFNGGTTYLVATTAQANIWKEAKVGTEFYENGKVSPRYPEGGIALNAGTNVLELWANWGYNAYDAMILIPGTGSAPQGPDQAQTQEPQIGPGWPEEGQEVLSWQAMEQGKLDENITVPETAMPQPERSGVSIPVVAAIAAGVVVIAAGAGLAIRAAGKRRKAGQEHEV